MKRLIILASAYLLSSSVFAVENVVMTTIAPSHGKRDQIFESHSFHSFHMHNYDNVYHAYKWHAKQCLLQNGKIYDCKAQKNGKIFLEPNQSFEFIQKLVMKMDFCNIGTYTVGTYAVSSIESDNPNDKDVMQEAKSKATCN